MRKYVKPISLLLIFTFLSLIFSYKKVSADNPEGDFLRMTNNIREKLTEGHFKKGNSKKNKYDVMGRIVKQAMKELSIKAGLIEAGTASVWAMVNTVLLIPMGAETLVGRIIEKFLTTNDVYTIFEKWTEEDFAEKLADHLLDKANDPQKRKELTNELGLKEGATDDDIKKAVKEQFKDLYKKISEEILGEDEEFKTDVGISAMKLPHGDVYINGNFHKKSRMIILKFKFVGKTKINSGRKLRSGTVVIKTHLKIKFNDDYTSYKWNIKRSPEVTTLKTNLTRKKVAVAVGLNMNVNPVKLVPGGSCAVSFSVTHRNKSDGSTTELGFLKLNVIDIDKVSMNGTIPTVDMVEMGEPATYTFTVAKPLKDKAYKVKVTAIPGDDSNEITKEFDLEVINLAPKITKIEGSASADPGGKMKLNNLIVGVEDDNADNTNEGEKELVQSRCLSVKLDDKEEFVTATGYVKENSTYYLTFNNTLDNLINPSYRKGVFPIEVWVIDDNGAKSKAETIDLMVNNIAPSISDIEITPNDIEERVDAKKMITITGIFRDENGSDDLNLDKCYVDVSKASSDQKKLFIGKGLDKIGTYSEVSRFVKFKTTSPFKHYNKYKEEKYEIHFYAEDKSGLTPIGLPKPNDLTPHALTYLSIEKSRNKPPEIVVLSLKKSTFCPTESFIVSATVKDTENDPLRVTAKIMRKKKVLKTALMSKVKDKNNLYKATLFTPADSGDYRVRINAREYIINDNGSRTKFNKAKEPVEYNFKVEDCDSDENPDVRWKAEVSPEEVCPGDRFTVKGYIKESWQKKAKKDIYPPGTITFLNNEQEVGPDNKEASFTAPEGKGTYPVMIILNYRGTVPIRMGPVLKVKECKINVKDGGKIKGTNRDPNREPKTISKDLNVHKDKPK